MEHDKNNYGAATTGGSPNTLPLATAARDFDEEVSETVRKYFKDTLRQARIFGENIGHAINEALEDEYRRGKEEALKDLFSRAYIDSDLIARLDKCGWAIIEKHILEGLRKKAAAPAVTPVHVEALRRCWQDGIVDAETYPQIWAVLRNLYYTLAEK